VDPRKQFYLQRIRKQTVYKRLRTLIFVLSRFFIYSGVLVLIAGLIGITGLVINNKNLAGFLVSLILITIGFAFLAEWANKKNISFFIAGASLSAVGIIFFSVIPNKLDIFQLWVPIGTAIVTIFLSSLLMFIGWLIEEILSVFIDMSDSMLDLNYRYEQS